MSAGGPGSTFTGNLRLHLEPMIVWCK